MGSKNFEQFQDSASHGGEDVPIYAVGPMAHLIHTTHDQTHIANVMAYSACVGAYKDLFEQRCRTWINGILGWLITCIFESGWNNFGF